ncbi:MAG: hypothetical protein IJY65_02195 [Clostridia bacterium]|nr:hypothetical protein [Clostridia bacterium]
MRKPLSFVIAVIIALISLVGCGEAQQSYNSEAFYGVVRFSPYAERLVVYIPEHGDVEIPECDDICGCFNGHGDADDDSYQLKAGDLVEIWFRYEKSDDGVSIMESYPARFSSEAYSINAYAENITYEKRDGGYTISLPTTAETESAEVGDTVYFVLHGGNDGRAFRQNYAEGEISEKADGIITVPLTMHGDENEFLKNYRNMTAELIWED